MHRKPGQDDVHGELTRKTEVTEQRDRAAEATSASRPSLTRVRCVVASDRAGVPAQGGLGGAALGGADLSPTFSGSFLMFDL
jgi:hypothetical protein